MSDNQLIINLHEAQVPIFNSEARFKVVAAGRRFGKSYLACYMLLAEGLKSTHVGMSGREYDLGLKEVYYIAPTFEQGKKILWPLIQELGRGIIASKHENTATCTLVNGRRVSIKGADRPDSLRGIGLSFVVLDEYAFMKEEVWEKIIRPALADVEGKALFIGTPEGENHFYKLFEKAEKEGLPIWEAWTYYSIHNPTLDKGEIEQARSQMSEAQFAQEHEASFTSTSGAIFKGEWWKYSDEEPTDGDFYIACDLSGFSNAGTAGKKNMVIRDASAIAVVKVNREGWYVKEIITDEGAEGWDVRETAVRIMTAYRTYRPVRLGIEKGVSKNAVLPYLEDEMKRYNVYFTPFELSHGNEKKFDRIRWALQGHAEKGRITLAHGTWARQFIRQAASFPSVLARDDLLDAVAYINQLASVVYFSDATFDNLDQNIDDAIGF